MDFIGKLASHVVRGGVAAGLFMAAVSAQAPGFNFAPSPGVAPSEANHFIATPKGWVHPRTAWGEPDLEGTWPIPAGINLVRPARSCPGEPATRRAGLAPPAPDPNAPPPAVRATPPSPCLTRSGMQGAPRCGRIAARRRKATALRRRSRRATSARPCWPASPIRDPAASALDDHGPADRPAAGADGGRQASLGADEEQLGAAPAKPNRPGITRRTSTAGIAASPAACRRRCGLPLQQRHADPPGAGHGDPQPRDDSRGRASSTPTAARR